MNRYKLLDNNYKTFAIVSDKNLEHFLNSIQGCYKKLQYIIEYENNNSKEYILRNNNGFIKEYIITHINNISTGAFCR